MTDQINDNTVAGTAKENVPTMSKPMDEIHSNVEDISNKASGYKVNEDSPRPPLQLQLPHSLVPSPFFPLCRSSLSRLYIERLIYKHKATLSNPNVSEGAKKNAQEMLGKLGGEDAFMKNNGKGE